MRNKFIVTLLFFFTLNLFGQNIILVKDSILNNYISSGFCSATFIDNGEKKYASREGFWKIYDWYSDNVYVVKEEKYNPIYGKYLLYQEGEYLNGEKNGKWNYFVVEDITFKKILHKQLYFKNGIQEGEYKYFHLNKKIAREGLYKNDKLEGVTKNYYDNGKLKGTMPYKNDKLEGDTKNYYDNGKLKGTMPYKNDLRIGRHICYYSTGIIEDDWNYSEGMKNGPYKINYKTGKKKITGNFKMNKLDGVFHYYHENGQLWTEKLYDNDLLLNVTANYDSKGKIMDKGTLKNGNGTVKLYDDSGILRWIETYKDGLKISEENF